MLTDPARPSGPDAQATPVPRTEREALIVEALGDVGRLLKQVDDLESRIRAAADGLRAEARAMHQATQEYRKALTQLEAGARQRMADHLVSQTREASREAARDAIAAIDRAVLEAAQRLRDRPAGSAAGTPAAAASTSPAGSRPPLFAPPQGRPPRWHWTYTCASVTLALAIGWVARPYLTGS